MEFKQAVHKIKGAKRSCLFTKIIDLIIDCENNIYAKITFYNELLSDCGIM